ncbi:class A beta-lactamase-related serine hydrolase [Rhodococcus rhodnii]|uniref:Penicillin-binding protein n=2 Tax=Rhodococcus rhodnii TaxID=38312 RepID=R7WQQ5_9NOCA|nr:serine hydrolase domain-containing protein [Rhodococcus rhodnii]EOM77615.1 penicillin-binding protein [Rhodococcus rhodnii LMG 5362]TXG90215.1 class A beta-lactamase-related serine hydrolase [Rhodococcus rhodnii]
MTTSIRTRPTIHISPGNAVSDDVDARLTDLVTRLSTQRTLHHVVLAVASADDRRHWSGGAGPAGTEPPPSPETPFFIASVTKRFIVTLLLQAHERGELHLDAPAVTYLPSSVTAGLHVRGGVDRTSSITVRHLASHTSGLPDFFDHGGRRSIQRRLRAGVDTAWTFDDVLTHNRAQRPHFDPQDLAARTQRARYSDTGFVLLICILETVTGTAFPDLIADRITTPLGLDSTWHPAARPASANLAAPLPLHVGRRRVDVTGTLASSHDLFSTTADLLVFERALRAGTLFTDPATRHLPTERSNRLRNAPVLRYGLGTMLFTVNRFTLPRGGPVTLVGHSGSTGTWLFTCPELGVHLAGTVDRTEARGLPFRIMGRCLRIWQRG